MEGQPAPFEAENTVGEGAGVPLLPSLGEEAVKDKEAESMRHAG